MVTSPSGTSRRCPRSLRTALGTLVALALVATAACSGGGSSPDGDDGGGSAGGDSGGGNTAAPVELTGFATRRSCGTGALWSFVLAPATTSIRGPLDELAAAASCP